ncbi:MAG: MBOAT family protein [Lachnospiraceae bacterium]|nr:MBOAT family protein [Lachnospiraceae bacterium]
MLFNSYIFIFLFFPICLIGYYGFIHFKKKELAQLFLVLMSFWFYGYFQINYLLIMILSIAGNYVFHKLLSRKALKGTLIIAIAANLGVLFYFKYFDFFITNINAVFGASFLLRHILLPLGISFFTFQQIGFIVDTYRGEIKDCKLLSYTLFVAFFPQLIAGPIVNQSEMIPQFDDITEKKFDCESFYRGLVLFILGLFKKVILADTLGAGVDYGYSHIELLGRMDAVLVIVFYSLQLYFDFSGYCDMAKGIGAMLGIELPINFNSPYKAANIVDFWKRWHITLNRFFTKYVYIPLGGNRKGSVRMYTNLLIVFLLSGIWHGAGWNFIVWGMMHGVLYVITRLWQRRNPSSDRIKSQSSQAGYTVAGVITTVASRIGLFIYVSVAWVYFRATDLAQGNEMLGTVLRGGRGGLSRDLAAEVQLDEFWYVLKVLHLDGMAFSQYIIMIIMLVLGLMFAMIMPNALEVAQKSKGKVLSCVLLGGIFVWCVLSFSQVSTFLYFNF